MKINFTRIRKKIIKTYVDVITLDEAIQKIVYWAEKGESKYVSIMNSNDVVKSWIDLNYREISNTADLSTPDGAPIALAMRLYGYKHQKRVTGIDLLEKLIPILLIKDLKIFFYGSKNLVLKKISLKIRKLFPNSKIYFKSPPYRKLTFKEDNEITNMIKEINPNVIFVGLGCPKQDIWISKKRKVISSVFIGIGAAFDYYAGTLERAPIWMQNNGLEWLYRLYKEPKRLFIRYLSSIFLFSLGLFLTMFLKIKN